MKNKTTRTIKNINISTDNELLYDGPFLELPLAENIIINKSIYFYDDPTPCFIHRSAIRTRLLAEIENELLNCTGSVLDDTFHSEHLPLLFLYTSFVPSETIRIHLT